MEKINRHNYEAFFLDYHEGGLTGEQMAEVILFLESNEDLMEEFYSFRNLSLDPVLDEESPVMDKMALYQGPVEANRADYFVGLIEGDLSIKEEAQLEEWVEAHPQFASELKQFEQTKLQPESVVYQDKRSLKQPGKVIPLLKYTIPAAAAAAVVMIFVTIGDPVEQDYHSRSLALNDMELIEFDEFNIVKPVVDYTPASNNIDDTSDRTNQPAPKEKLEQLGLKKPVTVDVSSGLLANNLGDKPTVSIPVQKEAEETVSLIEKATKYADHKIIGTPKAETTAQPLKLLEKGIGKVTKKETSITKEKLDERKRFSFKVGKFEFSKSKSGKGSRKKKRD